MLITLVLLVSSINLKNMSLFCENIEKVSLKIPGICQCFFMTWSILLFHVPQQNSSNDTMTGSFQISNTVNPLLTPPPPSWILLVSNTFEGSGIYLGGEGAYLIYRTWWYQVSIRIRLQSGKAQVQDVGCHAPGIKNKSELPARELVQMKFYGRDWLLQSIIY